MSAHAPLSVASSVDSTAPPTSFSTFDDFKAFIRELCCEKSGIDPILFEACVEFHEALEVTAGHDAVTPIHEELGWELRRFRHSLDNAPLYAAFFRNEDGSLWQAIVSIWDEEKERPYRYSAPKENGDRLFLPPIPSTIRQKISDLYGIEVPLEGSFWEWARSAPIPRLLTEGAKKSLAALSEGYLTLALYGCTCGVSTSRYGNRVAPYLKPDIHVFAFEKSQWLFAFDRDQKPSAIKAVALGKRRLTSALRDLHCLVDDIVWTPTEGKGIDDVIVGGGSALFDAMYQRALQRLEHAFTSPYAEKATRIPKPDIFATSIAEDYTGKLLWNDAHKTWMWYELHQKGVWSAVNDHYIDTQIQRLLQARGIRGYGSDAYIVNIRKFLSRELVTFDWDEREGILPFVDGIVVIATGDFAPHSPENRLTWCLPRKYHTPLVADWGEIRAWLKEGWPHPTDQELLLCFAAAVVRGRYDLQKFLYMVGTGGSGKGTYTRLLQEVLGERNTWAGKIEQLADKNDCARLINKKLAVFADQDKVTSGLQFFKNLTGQDELTAKRLYKDGFNFIFKGLALITANAPALLGAGSWMKRRALVVNCTHQPTHEKNLDALFAPELAAFTRYLLSISNDRINQVLRDDRPSSGEVTVSFWEMAQRQDSIAAWIDECLVFEEGAFTQGGNNKDEWSTPPYDPQSSTLFGSYHHFCRKTGLQGKSLNNFAPELEEMCQKVLGKKFVRRIRSSTRRGFYGIRLRREGEPRLYDTLLPFPDNPSDSFSDDLQPLSGKESDDHDDLFQEKISDNTQQDVDSIVQEPPTEDSAIPLDSQETIGEGRHSCHDEASTLDAVSVMASDDLSPCEVSPTPTTTPPCSSSWLRELTTGTRIRFQHEEVQGWRNGVLQEIVFESGFFVKVVVKANFKKRGEWRERTYTVAREDWLQPRR
ncbi:DUF3854 domain-containing protein [Tolypothrix sp. PCC 7910]|uniref:DUF3854 domain-containing protein n=1 Tax=Tolypothrix sp. PCC 7910 TaxID=2099387 RepID=UPI0014278285|nr:DUF3854 domain-containing protein [Tolypothrix sp. PCC 7910]QIR36852.1 DUF3854 domain-containing protein [Tolypothrix sp. PCC 7910]